MIHKVVLSALMVTMVGCSSGDMRMFNDSMAGDVYYPDQHDVEWVGDIKWTTGVKNESGFQTIYNSGDDYCKVRVTLEDDSIRVYRLDPGESTGKQYMSIYNQSEYLETICNSTSAVFNASFDD